MCRIGANVLPILLYGFLQCLQECDDDRVGVAQQTTWRLCAIAQALIEWLCVKLVTFDQRRIQIAAEFLYRRPATWRFDHVGLDKTLIVIELLVARIPKQACGCRLQGDVPLVQWRGFACELDQRHRLVGASQ